MPFLFSLLVRIQSPGNWNPQIQQSSKITSKNRSLSTPKVKPWLTWKRNICREKHKQKEGERDSEAMDQLLSWFLAFLLLFFVLCMVGYQIICLTDLEIDYINQYDAATRINKVVLPEFVSQGVLCFFYLVTGRWFMFLLSLPYLFYNIRLWKRNRYLIDVTEIYNNLKWEKNRRLFKLYYLLLLVVIVIFWIIWSNADKMH
ncbi:protein cornichon homolog 4-like [Syzygium oleosum]|uniref:protein cornichon homolog 4-like n=1 Tax=Syzygium oleosum TaxID=219896 RepID=UPI0024BB793A|nr:protein cornichon homolog 4-like [Syzygium oleosum]